MSKRELLHAMSKVSTALEDVWLPRIYVRLFSGKGSHRVYRALVDTGSYFTLAAMDIARELGLDLSGPGRSIYVSGVGGSGVVGYPSTVDIEPGIQVGQGVLEGGSLLLPASRVVFVTSMPAIKLLIGQHDALERLVFTQRCQEPTRLFALRAAE